MTLDGTSRLDVTGFIVSAWEERGGARRLLATGRLDDGRSFALVLAAAPAAVFVAERDRDAAMAAVRSTTVEAGWSTLAGAPLVRLEVRRADDAERVLSARDVRVRHVDRGRAADVLLSRGITGAVRLRGAATPGRRVDLVFTDPELSPATTVTPLRWLSMDLETDRQGAIVAAALAGPDGPGEVHFVGAADGAVGHASEAALLLALAERIRARDPDVITGWNVIDFDLVVLAERAAALGLTLDLGRTPGALAVRERSSGRRVVEISGRAVCDGLRLVRASAERFEDLSLDAVAHAVLGTGKTVHVRGDAKLAELERLRRDEPARFCAYCLRDAELVLEILAATGLDALTARRAALTGVTLELAWTSIPAFERIYGAALHARRVVPPPRSELPVSGAAGGTVLEAEAGVFANVLVFDFRSLYPSLMRTFNIDPLAHARAEAHPQPDDIVAPNGARFERREGLLPDILTTYARAREAAQAAGDETAAYVYKILQNSFYGVLGASGCRYARTELAGAITSFGKRFLTTARDWFEARGHHVLYGDTDSVFVLSGQRDDADHAALAALGERLAAGLNAQLTDEIRVEVDLPSYLHMRCDKVYRRFFIQRLRGEEGPGGRGRGKGYAGLRLSEDGTTEVEVKGMEAVRSDFTPLARRFQIELLTRLFAGADAIELRAYSREVARQVVGGLVDDELVYRKALRRPAEAYESETPQVRAARLLGWTDRRGRVDYVMTLAGAEPISRRSGSPIDHTHYLERQLLPIAQAIAGVLGTTADDWLADPRQLGLFPSER